MKFASTLKALREERNITQNKLALQLGITRSTIAGYETKGKQPDYDRLLQIAEFFQVPVDYLLTGDEKYIVSVTNISGRAEHLDLLKSYAKLSAKSREELKHYLQFLSIKEQETKKGDS